MDVTLTATTGREKGSRPSSRLRAEGQVPGVVYGLGSEAIPVSVEWPELRRVLTTEAGLNALITLTVDGSSNLSVVKELQRDPVRRTVTHVDFMLVDPNATLTVDVPLALVGDTHRLEQQKGLVEQLRHMLTIDALPGSIPTQIEVDISSLEIGTSVKVSDLVLPDGVTTDIDPDTTIAQGAAMRLAEVEEPVEGEGEEGAEGEGEGGEAAAESGGESSE